MMDDYELGMLVEQFKGGLLYGNDTSHLRERLINHLGGNGWMARDLDTGTFALYLQLLLMSRRLA